MPVKATHVAESVKYIWKDFFLGGEIRQLEFTGVQTLDNFQVVKLYFIGVEHAGSA